MDEDGAVDPTTLVGRYELGSLLGHGGMGTVRDATDRRLGRRVAVKIVRADLAEQPRARRRFETEAHAAARLAHPNVVLVFDSGEDEGVPFLVMERLPGRPLPMNSRAVY
jgi:serine/threonine protein kinase